MDDRASTGSAQTEGTTQEGPGADAASAVMEDLETLQSRVAAAEQKRDDYLSLLQRTVADFENYQKRMQRSLADEQRYAHAAFARELLPVLDNLQRALAAAGQQGEKGPLVDGVSLVLSQLLDIFGRFGVTPVDARGQQFDPNLHEGVMQQPKSEVAPGTVVDEVQPGYRLHERVLRPAKVVVASPPPTAQ